MAAVFTEEIQAFMHANYKGIGNQQLADKVNAEYGTAYSREQIKRYKSKHKLNSGLNGRFERGHIPTNKGVPMSKEVYEKAKNTMFKKGNIPLNHREVGSERLSKDGYIEIKVAEPRKWRLKHNVVWERINGPIPKGCVVIFLDGNKTNLDISNLKLITRSELLIMNRHKLFTTDPDLTEASSNIARLIDTKNKAVKRQVAADDRAN